MRSADILRSVVFRLRKLHTSFIENSLVGCDVMPSATHITASMLSSAFPEERYTHTNILTLPFGRQADGSVSLGAIEFLSTQGALSIIDTGALGSGRVGKLTLIHGQLLVERKSPTVALIWSS